MGYTFDFTGRDRMEDIGDHYWVNGERLSGAFCTTLPSDLADLLDVALAVYAADRRSRRRYSATEIGQRDIHVKLGVRNPELWSGAEVSKNLTGVLTWLSGDSWTFEFEPRASPRWPAEYGSYLFTLPTERPARVSLFSGGLDSLAGLAMDICQDADHSFVLVSGFTHNRLMDRQRSQVQGIRRALRGGLTEQQRAPEIRHVAVPYGIHKVLDESEEKTQRTRALVFLTLGVIASIQAGADTLWVHENGIGAMNLPLNEAQLGVDNYRGVHPLSLIKVRHLFESFLNRKIRIRNSSLFRTKAEMCSYLEPAGLAELAPFTVSCDGFPQRIAGASQCGYCTSCVLRRQSLRAAGLEVHDLPCDYRDDVFGEGTGLSVKDKYGFEAMRDQVQRLSVALHSPSPWQGLAVSFPRLAEVHAALVLDELDSEDVKNQLIHLFRTYVQEWDSLPGRTGLAA